MLKGAIKSDTPLIRGVISQTPSICGKIMHTEYILKGVVHNTMSSIKGTITKDVETEPYYEVSNEYGITIIIGD